MGVEGEDMSLRIQNIDQPARHDGWRRQARIVVRALAGGSAPHLRERSIGHEIAQDIVGCSTGLRPFRIFLGRRQIHFGGSQLRVG